ncbi:adenylate/guanylate cyclase domain-containing protein [Salegentibacter sp. F188]|uniref:Adenylate/guanylate cyclase domain-containing protein n=1 Tax=Autumnicola patrickiae TaxID=3075591 RepID=A0ABU3E401_9FLAO|nr:adenylate/guanylate cyclase domain-containing protein [Salegentibacter sp. F188]MDT0689982.1 adenylate/guanylate cyclase domain-containing protein [Salegentibacter sp. F188]
MKKHQIEFSQDGPILALEGKSILNASLDAGIPLVHVCGGKGKCSTCRVLVHSGEKSLSPENEKEKALKKQMQFPPNVRLACQTYISGGPVKLTRIVKDVSDFGLYIGSMAGEATKEIGEERELSIFFLDIRDFSPFMEKNLPFDVIHVIRKLFTFCENIIDSNGGRLIETAGDSLYAIFGYSSTPEKAKNAATKTAREIIENLQTLNKEYFLPHFDQNIEVGIGIHSGKVITGKIQLGKHERLIAMGHAVNVASRIQALTKELNNNLIVSDEVFMELENRQEKDKPTTARLKGVTGSYKLHLLGNTYC